MSAIEAFEGQFSFLSNFSPCSVHMVGLSYPTVEHAFQAAKTSDRHARLQLRKASTPGEAKKLGRKLKLRPDWEQIKDDVMLNLLRQKFSWSHHPRMATRLLDKTGTRALLEGNTWGDVYWGVNATTLKGGNKLGILLMQVREEIREEELTWGYYLVPPRLVAGSKITS